MSSELLPCPFCGGEAELDYMRLDYLRVMCTNCHAQIPFIYQTKLAAIAAWNQRTERICNDLKKYPNLFTCSSCRETQYERLDPNYCPNCGAKVVE